MKTHQFRLRLSALIAAVCLALGGGIATVSSATASPLSNHGHGHGNVHLSSHDNGNGNGNGSGNSNGNGQSGSYLTQVANVTVPTPYVNSSSFDISFVDPTTDTYYLADRTNAGIISINAKTDTFNTVVGAGDFTGLNTGSNVVSPAQTAACGTSEKGPNGVLALTVGGSNQVWAADGVSAANPVSNVKVFTIAGPTSWSLSKTILTSDTTTGTKGTCRADEMAYDPNDNIFVVANDVDSPPYLTFISVNKDPSMDAVVGQIKFPQATGGIEQTVWDANTGRFYTNLPGVAVEVINPKTFTVTTSYPTPGCTASGLALDPNTQQLLLSCATNPNGVLFMDAQNGQITANFPQVSGADEVWFDPGTDNFYLGASKMTSTGNPSTGFATPVLGVIASVEGNSGHLSWVENVPTGTTTFNGHSVAADPNNGQVFVPLAGLGVAVFAWAG